jgi:EAL domain-containing protein (putative c-di-GMP-specific phosphodiesterase class I)
MFGELLLELAPLGTPTDQSHDGVERILRAVRSHLGLEVAFASNVTDTEVIIRHCDAVGDAPFGAGAVFPAEDGYCKRVLDGRLPPLIADAQTVAEVAHLACTKEMSIGAHISVPLIFSDGRVYGTFCCFSSRADHSLTERDVAMMRAFADLAAAQIEGELTLSSREQSVLERVTEVIERDNMAIVYQPIYSVADNEIVGVEALARFPDSNKRGPDQWFAEAAEFGLGEALEIAAIRAALRGLSHLPKDVYLAINVSPEVLVGGEIHKLLADVEPGRVVIEITEHAEIADLAAFRQALEPLRSKVRVAVDDAGAGYSGLRHILDVEPDIIKLDMSLTRGIDRDPARAALATALVAFSQNIRAKIVAEGVETSAELAALRKLGAHCAQGYHLQRPKPISALSQFLVARRMGCSVADRGVEAEPLPSHRIAGKVAASAR